MRETADKQKKSGSEENHKEQPSRKGKRRLPVLAVILILLFVVSSVITGILLGNRTGQEGKETGDSFVIGEEGQRGGTLHLAGRITMPDGTPLADSALELHSVVRQGKTDSQGWFLFEEVECGLHSLFVMDIEGKTVGEIKVDLRRNEEDEYSQLRIEKTAANQYCFYLDRKIRYLELDMELKEGALTVRMDKTAAVDENGDTSLPGRTMEGRDGVVILPSGTVVTRGSHIIHGVVVILPDNRIIRVPEAGMSPEEGITVSGKGEITLPDGTVITEEGILYPDQREPFRPEYPIQLKGPEKGSQENNPKLQAGQETEAKESRDEEPAMKESQTPGAADADAPSKTESLKNQEEAVRPADKVESDDPSETLAPDYGDLGIYYEENGMWSVWTDAREISLFDYVPGQSATVSTADPMIQPGSTGYYPFEVTNSFSSHTVKIRVTVTEQTTHLPLSFRLVTVNGSGQKTAVSDWSSPLTGKRDGVVVANANASPPGSTVRYHLEWKWPYNAGRDASDTALARQINDRDRTYTLKLEINARR